MRAVHRSWLRALAVGTLVLAACTEMDEDALTPPDPDQQQTGLAAQAVPFLRIVQVPTATLRDAEQRRLAGIRGATDRMETYLAQVTPGAISLMQSGQAIAVQVSPTEQYVSVAERIDEYVPGQLSLVGQLQGARGTMSFTLTADGLLHGGIMDYGTSRAYELRSISNRFVAVSQVDLQALRADDLNLSSGISPQNHLFCGIAHPTLASPTDRSTPDVMASASYPSNTIQAACTIRLYLLRTDRAHNEAGGGMHGQIISTIG